MSLRRIALCVLLVFGSLSSSLPVTIATAMEPVVKVERQPLISATERLIEALTYVGAPLNEQDLAAIKAATMEKQDVDAVLGIQKVLDPNCLAFIHINPESRVKLEEGPVKKELMQQGWRTFLVKVANESGSNAVLQPDSPNIAPLYQRGKGARQKPKTDEKLVDPEDVPARFLDCIVYDGQPLKKTLSGLALEYRIVQLYSRDVGRREAKLGFHIGTGTQDIGFRNTVPILFNCVPAVEVVLDVKDTDGSPTTAAFVIRDDKGRVYPNPARRLAPDFFFHNQVYRADGESVHLPPGDYSVEISRGPEYLTTTHALKVKDGVVSQKAAFPLKRWIQPTKRGWFSGDHHVHAAGCAHYDSPTEGVTPGDMMRHILGEDLNVGCVLTWGPCWYHQKQFFEGKTSALSRPTNLMRYDIEVSGFPSSHAGHLCLLRLKEDDYPNTKSIEDWPSWTLPVLKWGKEQGGVVGYSHSGWGLALPDYGPNGERLPAVTYPPKPGQQAGRAADKLPDYAMPPFDGIGANEYIVTVAHNVCDFISAVDTPAIWELNIWYHTLNCGQRAVISGETDFPCIYGDKVGLGRIYVKLPPKEELTFDNWVLGVKDGRSYCGDGRSHLFDFKVDDLSVGEKGANGKLSQLNLEAPRKVKVTCEASALLEPKPTPATEAIRNQRLDQKPYWHIERCRVGESRKVPVELVLNGQAIARKEVEADGSLHPLSFDVEIPHSSWLAIRILPSAHTNPIYVQVGGKPIRASKRSAEWCIKAVETCWEKKKNAIRPPEREAAQTAYDFASTVYRNALVEAVAE